jgi:hypothetical protein
MACFRGSLLNGMLVADVIKQMRFALGFLVLRTQAVSKLSAVFGQDFGVLKRILQQRFFKKLCRDDHGFIVVSRNMHTACGAANCHQ